eukprot:TRINITY_DN81223_c0_g1_i1.p1 TRINITY_DN81223_c0_g1~~TRINITY_DN81223_c0_g1_i1.p1  ORF type:complete len:613 (+),score=76.00 TRINITY_DN81223_c0_g1_i1:102-1940(+)
MAPPAQQGANARERSRSPRNLNQNGQSSKQWILGVGTPTHDTGACLLRGGEVLHAVNEERFSRTKLDNAFPKKSIAYCLAAEGLKPADVDVVALGLWAGCSSQSEAYARCLERMLEVSTPDGQEVARERIRVTAERDAGKREHVQGELLSLGFCKEQLRWCDHHLCHATCAFYTSPFDEALVVTFDGRGDDLSGTVYSASSKSGLKLLDMVTYFDSVGYLYSSVTQYLQFKPFHHEGKVTGLAARGDSRKGSPEGTFALFSRCFTVEEDKTRPGKWVIRGNLGEYYKPFSTARPAKLYQELQKFSREDVAAGVQDITEHVVCEFLQRNGYHKLLRNICLCGGLFANVKLNQRVRELSDANIYVFPHMGDGGIGIGAAMVSTLQLTSGGRLALPACKRRWDNAFFGESFSEADVKPLLNDARFQSLRVDSSEALADKIAEMIAAGKVVGLCSGRMEFGPRALGHRSLLASATDASINDSLNARLKRSEFMPFAPVTLREFAAASFKDWRTEHECSRYMTMCFDTTPEFQKQCPACVHVDGTARPQIIDERDGLYHHILVAYHRRTSIPTVINTSFNAHGEPIVRTPAEAVSSFIDLDCCDALCVPPFLLTKGK